MSDESYFEYSRLALSTPNDPSSHLRKNAYVRIIREPLPNIVSRINLRLANGVDLMIKIAGSNLVLTSDDTQLTVTPVAFDSVIVSVDSRRQLLGEET